MASTNVFLLFDIVCHIEIRVNLSSGNYMLYSREFSVSKNADDFEVIFF